MGNYLENSNINVINHCRYILGVQTSHSIHTHGRIHFSATSLDLMFSGTTAITNTAAHLFIVICFRAVGKPVTRLPTVEANLIEKVSIMYESLFPPQNKKVIMTFYLANLIFFTQNFEFTSCNSDFSSQNSDFRHHMYMQNSEGEKKTLNNTIYFHISKNSQRNTFFSSASRLTSACCTAVALSINKLKQDQYSHFQTYIHHYIRSKSNRAFRFNFC